MQTFEEIKTLLEHNKNIQAKNVYKNSRESDEDANRYYEMIIDKHNIFDNYDISGKFLYSTKNKPLQEYELGKVTSLEDMNNKVEEFTKNDIWEEQQEIGFNNNGMKEQGINWFMLEITNKETGEKIDVKCNNQEISSKDWKISVLEPVVEAISKMDNTIPFERRDNIKDEIAEDIIENIKQDRDESWYARDNLR